MKFSKKSIFYKIGFFIFLIFLFMNAPFFPIKSEFFSGFFACSGISLMLISALTSNSHLHSLKNKKKRLLNKIL